MSEKNIKKTDKKKEKEIAQIEQKIENNIEDAEIKEEKNEHPDKKQIFSENKILVNFLIILGIMAIAFVIIVIVSNSSKSFTVDGVKYSLFQEGQLTLYNTKIPVVVNGTNAEYNIYLRNDPRTLNKNVPFNGSLYIRPYMVINASDSLNCNGDGILAVANIVNTYEGALGTSVIKDENVSCDNQTRYVYLNIQPSNETSVQEIAPACYNINVNNCQVLAATERYLTETFSTVQDYINSSH